MVVSVHFLDVMNLELHCFVQPAQKKIYDWQELLLCLRRQKIWLNRLALFFPILLRDFENAHLDLNEPDKDFHPLKCHHQIAHLTY